MPESRRLKYIEEKLFEDDIGGLYGYSELVKALRRANGSQ